MAAGDSCPLARRLVYGVVAIQRKLHHKLLAVLPLKWRIWEDRAS